MKIKQTIMRGKTLLIISIIILIAIGLFFTRFKILTAYDFDSKDVLKTWIVKNNSNFTIYYTHSVELSPVTETYLISNADLVLIETSFKSFGAGLPADNIYDFEIKDNSFRLYNINKTINPLIYRTGKVIANHKIIINNESIPFYDFSFPGEKVCFKVKNILSMKIF